MPLLDWLQIGTSGSHSTARPDYYDFIADDGTREYSDTSSPSTDSLQPLTPQYIASDIDRFTMPTTSPIDIATPSRNASSSPSSQGKKVPNYHDSDSRASAMMSAGFDPSMGRGRQDSFAGAKPISMNNPHRNGDSRPRRESLAGSLVGGMSWGGVSVGSWIRDEYVNTLSQSGFIVSLGCLESRVSSLFVTMRHRSFVRLTIQ